MGYKDSRGVEMADMSFAEALGLVHDLASCNLPDEHDIARHAELHAEGVWQSEALETLGRLQSDAGLMETLVLPRQSGDWPLNGRRPDRADDPSVPSAALKIVLQMASNAMVDPVDVQGVVEAEAYARDAQAINVVSDLVGLYSARLDADRGLVPRRS